MRGIEAEVEAGGCRSRGHLAREIFEKRGLALASRTKKRHQKTRAFIWHTIDITDPVNTTRTYNLGLLT